MLHQWFLNGKRFDSCPPRNKLVNIYIFLQKYTYCVDGLDDLDVGCEDDGQRNDEAQAVDPSNVAQLKCKHKS